MAARIWFVTAADCPVSPAGDETALAWWAGDPVCTGSLFCDNPCPSEVMVAGVLAAWSVGLGKLALLTAVFDKSIP